MSKLGKFAAACAAVLCAFGLQAAPERRVKMHVAGFTGYYELENFPLLVRISPERIEGFSYDDCAANGADISFVLEDGTLLAHEVDTWNPQGESVVWVSLPKFGQQTTFYFRWKDAAPPEVDSTAVWTKAGYVGVWHFSEASGDAADSSGNGYTAKVQGAKADGCVAIPGAVGTARQMAKASGTGANQVYFTVPDVPKSVFEQSFTLSFWGNITAAYGSEYVFTDKSAATDDGFGIHGNGTYNSKFEYMLLSNGSGTTKIGQMAGSVIDDWANYDFFWDGAKVGLNYLGVARATRTGAMTPAVDGFAFGSTMDGSASAFRGKADEMRLRTGVTTLDWSLAENEQVLKSDFVVADSAAEIIKAGVRVTSSAMEFSDGENPVYGEFEMTAGQSHTFTAPATVEAQDGAVTATCTGWTLVKVSDGSVVRTSESPAAGEDTTTCIVTYSEPMTLTWRWTTVLNPGFAVTYYVSQAGSGQDGLSWATAFKHPQDAIDAAAGTAESPAVILLNDGAYPERTVGHVHAVMNITKGHLTVKSVNGPAATVLDGTRNATTDAQYAYRPLVVAPTLENVLVTGFTLKNGNKQADTNSGKDSPTSLVASSGVLSNLVVVVYCRNRCNPVMLDGTAMLVDSDITVEPVTRNNGYPNQSDNRLVAIMGSAIVDRCRIHDISPLSTAATAQGAVQPVGLYSSGAVLRNSLVIGCAVGGDGCTQTAGGGAVYASAGTIENCTIVGNACYAGVGGLYLAGSVICRNNIVWGNTTVGGAHKDIEIAASKTPSVTYTCASDVTTGVDGNVNGDPSLNEDGTLPLDSLVTGAGDATLGWLADAVDLARNPRLWTDGTVSLGAYEPQGRSKSLLGDFVITNATDFGNAPFAVGLKATVKGASGDETYLWEFGDGASSTEVEPTHVYTVPGCYTVKLTVTESGFDPLEVVKPALVTAVGETCYVKEGAVGVKPYDTWEKATGDIEAALALRPANVVVTNGTYVLAAVNGLTLDWPVAVRSVEGPVQTVLDTGARGIFGSDTTIKRHLTLGHAQALVCGFTFDYGYNQMIVSTGGRIENCWTRHYQGTHHAQPVEVTDTTLVDCVFDFSRFCRDDGNAWYFGSMNALTLKGHSLADRCVVSNFYVNVKTFGGTATVGAIYLSDQAVARNCFVTGNEWTSDTDIQAHGVVVSGVSNEVANCTIVGNVRGGPDVQADGMGLRVSGTEAIVANNIVWDNRVCGAVHDVLTAADGATFRIRASNLLGEDPCFADDGSGYRITKDSPCRNAGCKVDWALKKGMATDIDGQERRCGPIDIGCWELQRPLGLMLMVR